MAKIPNISSDSCMWIDWDYKSPVVQHLPKKVKINNQPGKCAQALINSLRLKIPFTMECYNILFLFLRATAQVKHRY